MDNRETILLCALELFSKRGYDAVGVQEIAEKAGITKPTLYYYFKSKLGLLEALIAEKGEPLLEKISGIPAGPEPFEQKVCELARVYVDFCRRERQFYFFMLGLMYSPAENEAHEAAAPFIAGQYKLVVEIFSRSAAYLGNMNGRQEQFAIGFLGTVNCCMMVYNEKGMENMVNEETIDGVIHQFLHGIYS